MMVILLNCVTLGMYQPCVDDQCQTNRCKILQLFDDFIFAFFSLEMMIKMVAMGVYGPGSYLADSWNRLDLFIVMAGALEYCLNLENMNLSAIRTIRVLRPLRAINRIPSMRILVMLLLDTLPMLGNVLLLCFFVFFIFGIVGVQLWQGILRQRCFVPIEMLSNITKEVGISQDVLRYYTVTQEQEYICSKPDHSGLHRCENLQPYVNTSGLVSRTCNLTYVEYLQLSRNKSLDDGCINWNYHRTACLENGGNPFQGTISFDNIGLAWVAIFLVISLEGWSDIMYYVQDAHSFWDWIYFVLLIVIGSFFMINLCLVVIATQFSETKKREMERMRLERARFQSSSTLASSTNNSEPTSCYAEIIKYIAHLWRRTKRRAVKKIRLLQYRREQRREKKIAAGETLRLNFTKKHHPCCPRIRQMQQVQNMPNIQSNPRPSTTCTTDFASRDKVQEEPKRPSLLRVPSSSNQDVSTNNNDSSPNLLSPPVLETTRRRSSVMFSDVVLLHGENGSSPSGTPPNNMDKKNMCSFEKMTQTGNGNIWQISMTPNQQQITEDCYDLSNGEAMTCQELLALSGINAALPTGQIALDTLLDSLSKGITNRNKGGEDLYLQLPDDDFTCCQDLWQPDTEYKNTKRSRFYVVTCTLLKGIIRIFSAVRRYIKLLVEHKYFQQGILLAILINTLSMGIEYHKQPPELTAVVETSNIVFSAIFAIEMLLKIIAEGPFGYISNGFNVFDGIIVILSAIELCQKYSGVGHGDSGLSVLRTFRLLRILKLVRFMPNLRRQLFVMLRTMDNVAIFFSLLILFIFIFSILGMYLFGGKFCKYTDSSGEVKSCTCEMIVTKDPICECDRKHFNNILWATVTVFQILTQEDWNIVLANGMEKTSHWAALYFVALMTFGNYVLFNLLVAILVEGFSSERNERREREQRELARRKMSLILEGSLRHVSDSSRSISSSSGSYTQDPKNCWRSAEELRKVRDPAMQRNSNVRSCHCKERLAIGTTPFTQTNAPKCNIEKEILRHPLRQNTPPIITHTAATPQDSPCATIEEIPGFRYTLTEDFPSPTETTLAITSSSEASQKTSKSSYLKPPSLSPPPLNFRQFERPLEDILEPPTGKIIMHNERIGSKTTTFSEKVSPAPSVSRIDKTQNSDRPRRRSWKVVNGRRNSHRKKTRSGSDSDATPLNNGRDHSHCNGGGVNQKTGLRRDSLLQSSIRIQNDTQKDAPNNTKDISPQNSLRSRSNTNTSTRQVAWTPPLTRHNSLSTSTTAQSKLSTSIDPQSKTSSPTLSRKQSYIEPKPINSLNDKAITERTLPKIQMEDNIMVSEAASQKSSKLRKLLLLLEPKGCLKERDEYALYIFPPNNRFRKMCIWLVGQNWFDNVVLLFIAMNCITLAMERPNIPPDSTEKKFLSTSNYIFTFVFTVEMFIKVVACGMCYGPDAYFTSGWNIMDGSLVIISIVDLLINDKIFGILRVFRLLRSLRPLRVINRAPGLKLVVQTLLSSLRPIGNIVLICCTFFIIFGILGVQLFKGSFYYCIKGDVTNRTECVSQYGEKAWVNQEYNFDDLGQALMSLFVLSSRDGWVNIMYNGLDAVGEDLQPVVNYSEWRLLYFISFILLVGFFVLNMFVGVVVENFHRCREEQEKEERVRRAAKRALQLEKRRRRMNEPPYYINYSQWRLSIHNVVTSKYFDLAIAAVIGLNVVTMATERYKMQDTQTYILKIFNYFFTAVFILEGLMKLIALGVILYLKDKWNQLDVIIVTLSVAGIVLEELKSNIIPINPTVLRVMRVMRIARVLKLLKMAKGIRALLDTVMQALPQVGNLGLLFFLLFFIFAALGVELFGKLECSEARPCQGLGEHAHFKNFGMAFLTLFRVATGDNWNGIMKDTLRKDCNSDTDCVQNCCVSPVIAPIFFVIFVLMAQFVLVNVVVAVLMKHLEESHKHLEDEQDMDNQLEREFQEKQELEERRGLCLALQMDSECMQPHKPLTKVLSLPANFTYNPPGTKGPLDRQQSSRKETRRQTLHSQQPITLGNMEEIKSIDESLPDVRKESVKRSKLNLEQIDLNDIVTVEPKKEDTRFLLAVPQEHKPLQRLYGSTKHLFSKQRSLEITEETPFLLSVSQTQAEVNFAPQEMKAHDSQESVQRIISERRRLDDNLKDVNQHDIFEHTDGSEEDLVGRSRDDAGSENG